MREPTVHGTTDDRFESVRAEFQAVLAEEAGAVDSQLAVHVDGRLVVDLWGGPEASGDSLLAVYSSGKGAVYLVVALLVQDGVLDLDRTVASYWPEFAAAGKDRITLRELLGHRAGVIGVDGGLRAAELADDRLIAARLAGQKPYWEPGTAYGYHAFVIGALVGEVVRRASGRTLHQWWDERLRDACGVDLFLGLPEAEEHRYLSSQPAVRPALPDEQDAVAPDLLASVAFQQEGLEPNDIESFPNSRAVRELGQSSAGAIGSARGLARMYSAAVTGVDGRPPLLTESTVSTFSQVQRQGTDLVTGDVDHFTLGFEAEGVRFPFLGPRAFGHSGAAGAEAFVDPDTGLVLASTRRRFSPHGNATPGVRRLVRAVTEASARGK